jgi:hypothetical protein
LIQTPGRWRVAGVIFGIGKPKTTGRIGRKNRPNTPHRELPVKVTAWIDEGIVPLVLALNDLPHVETIDSCQGGEDKQAHVYFRYRGDAAAAVRFIADLAGLLCPHERSADYTLTARWRPGTGEPVFQLACPATDSTALARVLRSV